MAANPEKIRAFVAIHPPREVIDRLIVVMDKVKRELNDPALRWVKPEQIHLTLQFLGYIPREQVDAFGQAIEQAVSTNTRLSLQAESLGCFPSASRPRVLWVGLSGQVQELQKLKSDLDQTLSPLGYQPETRPFHPHLTLARVSGQISKRNIFKQVMDEHVDYSAGDFPVEAVHLMQSLLSPKGSTYHALGSFSLQSG